MTDQSDRHAGVTDFPVRLWLPPLLLIGAFTAGSALSPDRGSQAFYEAGAQIIPVIMLTLAIEARAFEWTIERRGLDDWWSEGLSARLIAAGGKLFVLGVPIAAEIVAVVRLADPRYAAGSPRFVFAAIVMGLLAVALAAVPPRRRPPSS